MNTLHLRSVVRGVVFCIAAGLAAYAQSPSTEEVLRRAVANEEKLRAAELEYTYRQSVLLETIGQYGRVTGELRRLSDVITDDLGNRTEKILEYPPSRLASRLGIARPDFKSLVGVDPFFLTPASLAQYSIKFVEREKVDSNNTFVFDVEPGGAAQPRPRAKDDHPFTGRIWIEDHDFQIVKVEGKAIVEKDDNQAFPKFTCSRVYVDGKWWLPSVVLARDLLEFKRYDLSIKLEIKYTDHKRITPRR